MADLSFLPNKEGVPVLRLCPNGDIYWNGRLVESDKELGMALFDWFNGLNGLRPLPDRYKFQDGKKDDV